MKPLQFLTLIFLGSCAMDYVYDASIINQTSRTVHVLITYDRKLLDSIYEGKSYYNYLKSISTDTSVKLISFDSVDLRSDYVLPPYKMLTVEHGMGGRTTGPNYKIIQEIAIQKYVDTINLKHHMLDTSFRKVKAGEWLLEIK